MDRANGDMATMTRNHYERLIKERDEARTTIEDAKRALNATDYEGILLAALRVKEERDEARERERVAIVSWEEERQRALREGHRVVDAIEKNAKLRDIAERAIERIERENWGITEVADFWKQLRVELDQLKEGAKCPVCSPEQKCWECADDVSREGAK